MYTMEVDKIVNGSQKKQFEGIQAVRGFAITLIVLSHFNSVYGIWSFASFFGSVGVDFFVVLSGFLALYNYKSASEQEVSIKQSIKYSIGKIRKSYKLHIITLFVMVVFEIVNIYFNGGDSLKTIVNIVALPLNIFLLQAFVPIRQIYYSYNGVAWYLSITMWFYFITTYCNLKVSKLKEVKTIFKCLLLVYGLQIVLVLLVVSCTDNYGVYHAIFYVNPFFRSLEFIIGMLVGALYKNGFLLELKKTKSSIFEVVAGLIFLVFMYNFKLIPSGYNMIAAIPIICIISYLFVLNAGVLTSKLTNRLTIFIGNISFEIFLIHFVVLSYINMINKQFLNCDMKLIIIVSFVSIAIVSVCYNVLNNSKNCLMGK